jgi:hypothetical protein
MVELNNLYFKFIKYLLISFYVISFILSIIIIAVASYGINYGHCHKDFGKASVYEKSSNRYSANIFFLINKIKIL